MKIPSYFLSPSFLRFWLGNFLSQTGTGVTQIALILYLYKHSGRPMDVAMLMAVQMIPQIFFAPVYGVLIDRFEKKKQLIIYQIIPGFLVLTLVFVQDIRMIYLLAFAISTVSALIYPTSASALPMVVEQNLIVRANSMIASSESLVHVLAPALAGVIVSLVGFKWAYILDSISFMVGALLLATVSLKGYREKKEEQHFMEDMKAGLRYLRDTPMVRFTGILLFSAMFFVGILFPILPDFNEKFLGGDEFSYGIIMMFFGIGGVAGGLLGGPASKRFGKGRLLFFTLLIDGLIMAAWSRVYWVPASCFILMIWGFNIFIFVVAYTSMIQEYVEEHFRGRVFSLFLQLESAAILMAVVLSGYLSDFFNTSDILFVTGILYFITIGLISFTPDYRRVIRVR